MTQEIKDKLEQAAEQHVRPIDPRVKPVTRMNSKNDFIKGAQTILENPKDWGLMPILESMDHIEESDQNWSEVVEDLKSQLAKYREFLDKEIERLETIDLTEFGDGRLDAFKVAKEVLKQQ